MDTAAALRLLQQQMLLLLLLPPADRTVAVPAEVEVEVEAVAVTEATEDMAAVAARDTEVTDREETPLESQSQATVATDRAVVSSHCNA